MQMRLEAKKGCAIALGTFDGLHIGHMRLIEELLATANGAPTAVIAFSNIPASFFGVKCAQLLTSEEKETLFAQTGIDYLVLKEFNQEIAGLKAEAFAKYIFDELEARAVVVGYNYSFGAGGLGSPWMLLDYAKQRGTAVRVVAPITLDEIPVSASRIRAALQEGRLELASRMLGRPYFMTGTAQSGQHLARTLGYPTINVPISEEKLCPAYGVYSSRVFIEGKYYQAMTYLGTRPTVNGTTPVAESHLFGYESEAYGKKLKIELHVRLRGEKRFETLEALEHQLAEDKKNALQTHFSMLD